MCMQDSMAVSYTHLDVYKRQMCINPNDPKNAWLKGKKVIVPLVNRVIPVSYTHLDVYKRQLSYCAE